MSNKTGYAPDQWQQQEVPVTGFADRQMTCRDCGTEFLFTVGEQEFYRTKGLTNDPGRCPECRALRREGKPAPRSRMMHEVTCAVCGTMTEVPFLPTQGRPVYCQDCFQQIKTRT
jgi:CxxC-x17-CxxC domain-containing protein